MDTISWVAESAILVSSMLLTDGAAESYAPLCMLTWAGKQPTPDTFVLSGGLWQRQPFAFPALLPTHMHALCV